MANKCDKSHCPRPSNRAKLALEVPQPGRGMKGYQMELYEVIGVHLRHALRWWWLFVLFPAVAGISAFVFSMAQAPAYVATANLLVGTSYNTNLTDSLYAGSALAKTFGQLFKTDSAILAQTRLSLSKQFNEGLLRATTATANVAKDGQVLSITAEAPYPAVATAFANAAAASFTKYIAAMAQTRFHDLLQDLDVQLKEARAGVSASRTELAGLQAQKTAMAPEDFAREEARLQGQIATQNDTAVRLQESYTSTRIASTLHQTNLIPLGQAEGAAQVADPAYRNGLFAGVLGLVLAIGAIFLLEFIRDHPVGLYQAAGVLQVEALGTIPHYRDARGRRRKASYETMLEQSEEYYRILRLNLQNYGVSETTRTVLMTSLRAGDGKSISLAGVALASAADGQRVTVIDADLRRPSQHVIFGMENRRGLSCCLADELRDARARKMGDDVPLRLSLPYNDVPRGAGGLRLITAGSSDETNVRVDCPPMKAVLERCGSEADLVLVDGPPLLAAAEALSLAKRVDGVLLLIDPAANAMRDVVRAKRMLDNVGASLLGIVFNKAEAFSMDYYYSYGRYGRYGRYGWDGRERRDRRDGADSK